MPFIPAHARSALAALHHAVSVCRNNSSDNCNNNNASLPQAGD